MALKEIFQFISGNNISNIEKALKNRDLPEVSVIIDLEDSLQNVIDGSLTNKLKREARTNLLNLFRQVPYNNYSKKIGVRINSIRTYEFINDLKFLREGKNLKLDYIIVPKLVSRNELEKYKIAFINNKISFSELIPIVENKEGIKNLQNILSSSANNYFNRIFWGHHDYNLDMGNFPFMEHTSKEYWELTKWVIELIEKNGFSYINGVVTELDNYSLLSNVIGVVTAIAKNNFGAVALSFGQTKFLTSIEDVKPIHYSKLINEQNISETEKLILAENIVDNFTRNYSDNKSFILDEKKIVSPHLFLAAKKYLNKKILVDD